MEIQNNYINYSDLNNIRSKLNFDISNENLEELLILLHTDNYIDRSKFIQDIEQELEYFIGKPVYADVELDGNDVIGVIYQYLDSDEFSNAICDYFLEISNDYLDGIDIDKTKIEEMKDSIKRNKD